MTTSSNNKVSVSDGLLRIQELVTDEKDVVSFFTRIPDDLLAGQVVRALRIGVLCLERANSASDLEFFRHEVERLMERLQTTTETIPSDIGTALAGKIGTNEGQLLSAIPGIMEGLNRAVNERINDVKSMLEKEVDPSKTNSTLGIALAKVQQMVDPDSNVSIQGKLANAVSAVAGQDGELAKTVKAAVSASLSDIKEKIDKIADRLISDEARADVIRQTTLKGPLFEEEVFGSVQEWCKIVGCEVEHTGGDSKPGDIVVKTIPGGLSEEPLVIVIEAKDDAIQYGPSKVGYILQEAMATRSAQFGIFVKKGSSLGKDIGEWGEGQNSNGRWVACTHEQLNHGLRYALVQHRINAIRRAVPSVDIVSVETQVSRIRNNFQKLKNINTQVTTIGRAAEKINSEAGDLRADIEESLQEIERALREANTGAQVHTAILSEQPLPLAS